MNAVSARTVPETTTTFKLCLQKPDSVGLTAFREDGTLNHSGHRSVKSEPGFHLVLIKEDLFEVEVEDVKFEEGAIHKALKHMELIVCCLSGVHLGKQQT